MRYTVLQKIVWTLSLLTSAGAATAAASPDSVRTERAKVALISDRDAVAAGKSFWVGFHFELTPGWHTYWRNPGDAGNPFEVTWELPDGVAVGTIRWPQPHRIPSGTLMSFGYEDEVVLLTRMSVFSIPANAESLDLRARASWIVCADICVPEEGNLTLTLKTKSNGVNPVSAAARLIERYSDRLPDSSADDATFRLVNGKIELVAAVSDVSPKDIADLWFFPDHYGHVEHAAEQTWQVDGNQARIELIPGDIPLQPSDSLEGLIAARFVDGTESSWRVIAPLRSAH